MALSYLVWARKMGGKQKGALCCVVLSCLVFMPCLVLSCLEYDLILPCLISVLANIMGNRLLWLGLGLGLGEGD
jgi:hypothetical protein